MLVLTRKADQKIRIGDNIEIVVLRIQEGQVSLGFTAPKELEIVREELLANPTEKSRKKKNENRQDGLELAKDIKS